MATQQGTREWYVLVDWLFENFEKDDLNKVLFVYDALMETDDADDHDEQNYQQHFYNTIDCDEDKLQAAIKLKNVMKALQYHSYFGENVAEKVQGLIERLEIFRRQFELQEHQVFIGREEEVRQIIQLLSEERSTGIVAVSLCGIGGQGKSQLAREVCRQLAGSSPNLLLVKADLRNKETVTDIMKSLLASAGVEYPSGGSGEGSHDVLEKLLKQYIQQLQTGILFCLDDCDQVMKNDRYAFIQFLETIFEVACDHKEKVRLLLTTREKLQGKMSGRLAEFELRELEKSDAKELLNKCSNMVIDEKVASAIVKECACSPLALTVVSDLLKSGKFAPERLLFHLKMDEKNVTQALKVRRCIEETIQNLNNNLQKALVSLSVFQSSPFEMEDARYVIDEPENKMQKLYNCHLIEVEDSRHSRRSGRNLYSLHPLVYRYISEWKKPKDLLDVHKKACQKFVSKYESKISKIVQLFESKYWKGQRELEFQKVHILHFYEIMTEHPELLDVHRKTTSDKDLLVKKRVSDLADILLCLVKNRRMFQSEADRAIKQKNHAVYIFWMVEKADIFVMLHDSVDLALEILDEITDRFPTLRDLRDEPFYPCLVHGFFHKVKGICRWKQRRHQDGLEHLKLSIKFYQLSTSKLNYNNQTGDAQADTLSPYRIFESRVHCFMGAVYLDMGELDLANGCFEEGHKLVKNMVKARSRDSDELANELHWDIPRYYTQYGKINLLKAKAANDHAEKEKLLDLALNQLERGIRLDKRLKLDYLDGYFSKLKLRVDVNIERGLLMKALEESNMVLDRRRAILQPPHTHYTESVYQVGRIYMLIGNDLHEKQKIDEAKSHWLCSSDYFKELKDCHLKDGGISLENPVYQEIKKDHLKVTELTDPNQLKQIQNFYRRLERGDFQPEKISSIRSMKQMLWTPVEMIKKYFGSGGQEFGDNDQAVSNMENVARVQLERMAGGEPSGGARRDSGMSSGDYGDSLSSGSGSMSDRLTRMHLEKSLSVEDDVFQDSVSDTKRRLLSTGKKRQKTIAESEDQ